MTTDPDAINPIDDTTDPSVGATAATDTAAAAPATPSDRDVQRNALRDLVQLSTECAATESEIEQKLHTSIEETDRELERSLFGIEQRYKTALEQVEGKYREKCNEISAQHRAESAAAAANDQNARQRAAADYSRIDQEVKKKFNGDVWLADSVLDVTENRIRADAEAQREQIAAAQEDLAATAKSAAETMVMYGLIPPEAEPADVPPPPAPEQADEAFTQRRAEVDRCVAALRALRIPHLFVGIFPYVAVVLLCGGAGVLAQWLAGGMDKLQIVPILIAVAVALGITLGLGMMLRVVGNRQSREAYTPVQRAVKAAYDAAAAQLQHVANIESARRAEAQASRQAEVQKAKDKYAPVLANAAAKRDGAIQATEAETARQVTRIDSQRETNRGVAEEWHSRKTHELQRAKELELQAARERHARLTADSRRKYDEARVALERRLRDGLVQIQAPIGKGFDQQTASGWDDPSWATWTPPKQFVSQVRFGQLLVDLRRFADSVPHTGELKLKLPDAFSLPASLVFPRQASLLIHADRTGRDAALRTVQMVMTRLLTSLPPGRVRFNIIDPVGLGQNFAGFMHLADYDDALVGGRILSDAEQIERRLIDLTEHMETVIQKYLRNEFETIDDYNAQAGELAEPYRFLVIADFPVNVAGDALRRLSSIVTSGARCGVYTIIMRDTRQPAPPDAHMDDLMAYSVNLVQEDDHFVWKDEVFGQFPLTLDPPPGEEALTQILHKVGKGAIDAKRVEVPFDSIAPDPAQFWTMHSAVDLRVPVGRMGATRLQTFRLGKGVAQHAIIAGKTGSGKSTLLHAMVTNLSMWYSPEEVEFYLIDFKKGVEFKTYATHTLPHARAIAVESDREFGLSVLQRLDAELTRRGELYRKLGVQDLAAYRKAAPAAGINIILPRTLLMIDEFQEFFTEDDKLAQEAALLLDRLVRQGRAFGLHVLLGSQTIGGSSGLPRSTIGQMAVRVALQCSEADSQLILGDNNSAARLLSRPGEAIYNDAGGLVEANSPFQVAWLADDRREQYLIEIAKKAKTTGIKTEAPIVFEGNAPADVAANVKLAALLAADQWPAASSAAPLAWLGEPVAIKDSTAVTFRRQAGANLLIVGQSDDSAMAMLNWSIISLAAQHAPQSAEFYVFDGSPADSHLATAFPAIKAAIPHEVKLVEWRAVPDAINELAQEVQRRQAAAAEEDVQGKTIYVLIYALQRYRMLRKGEDDFGFSMGGAENEKPNPGKQFADLIREGPSLGIHVLAWADTMVAIDRTLDRNGLREFDNRVLFQMSANDSSNLIDSPAANKLGFYRALIYSEEQGFMEKFRPYALPAPAWLAQLKAGFDKKH